MSKLKAAEFIQKHENCKLHELKPKDIGCMLENLLERHKKKWFLHRIKINHEVTYLSVAIANSRLARFLHHKWKNFVKFLGTRYNYYENIV